MVTSVKIGNIFCQPADDWVRYYQVVKLNGNSIQVAELATKSRTFKGTTWVSPISNAIIDYPITVKLRYDTGGWGIDLPRGGYGYRMTVAQSRKGVELYR